MEIVGDLGQAAAARELLLQHGDLVGFGRVRQRLHLALLVHVELCLALDLLLVPIVSLLLILVTLHHSILSLSSGLIGLQRGHQFIGASNRLVEAAPGLLWLVHERVLLGDLHPLDDVLATDDVLICWCQLEHLVREPLLRRLVLLQLSDVILVVEELAEYLWIAANVVNIGRELGLLLV